MKRRNATVRVLLLASFLLGPPAFAGTVSGVAGTLDVTTVPAPPTAGVPPPILGGVTNAITATQKTLTVSTSGYVAGYVMGGLVTFTMPVTGFIQNATISYASGSYTNETDLILFNAAPTGGGVADSAAVAITATDHAKEIGFIPVTQCASDNASAGSELCEGLNQTIGTVLAAGTTLNVAAVVRGTPTFATAADVIVTLYIVQ
jgi:hypothetical protein